MALVVRSALKVLVAVAVLNSCSHRGDSTTFTPEQLQLLNDKLTFDSWGDSLAFDAGRKAGIEDALDELRQGRATWCFYRTGDVYYRVEPVCGLLVQPRTYRCIPSEERSGRALAHDSTIAAAIFRTGAEKFTMLKWRSDIETPDSTFHRLAAQGAACLIWPERNSCGNSGTTRSLNIVDLMIPDRAQTIKALAAVSAADSLRSRRLLWSRVQDSDSIFAVWGDSAAGLAFVRICEGREYFPLEWQETYLAIDMRTGMELNRIPPNSF